MHRAPADSLALPFSAEALLASPWMQPVFLLAMLAVVVFITSTRGAPL